MTRPARAGLRETINAARLLAGTSAIGCVSCGHLHRGAVRTLWSGQIRTCGEILLGGRRCECPRRMPGWAAGLFDVSKLRDAPLPAFVRSARRAGKR